MITENQYNAILKILYEAMENLENRTEVSVCGVSLDYTVGQYDLAREILELLEEDDGVQILAKR